MNKRPVLIDLDGTILSDPTLQGELHLGLPFPGAKTAIAKLREKYYVVVYTARSNFNNEQIKQYLERHGIIVDEVDNSKRFGVALIDDRNIQFKGWECLQAYELMIQDQIDKEEVDFKYDCEEEDND